MRMLGTTQIGNLTVYEEHEARSKPSLPGLLPPRFYSFTVEPKPDHRMEFRPVVLLQRPNAQLKLSGREKPKRLEAHVHESEVLDLVERLQILATPKPKVALLNSEWVDTQAVCGLMSEKSSFPAIR